MYDVNMKVAENVYLALSKMAEDAGKQIGGYCEWVVGRHLDRDEEIEAYKSRNAELLKEVRNLKQTVKDYELDAGEKTEEEPA